MAEPFLLRPWEIARLTDRQIRLMIDGQRKVTESVKSSDKPESMDEPEETPIIGDGAFVSPSEAKAFMKDVESKIYL